MMKKILLTPLIALCFIILGVSQANAENGYDGLYSNGNYISTDHGVRFCTVVKGDASISWLMKQARSNTAVETNLSDVKEVGLNSIRKFTLKYKLDGEVRFTIGTDIGSFKKIGFSPFETPCINNDDVLNFTNHINSPFSKRSKGEVAELKMSDSKFSEAKKIIDWYKKEGVPVYGIVWEAVSGRRVDKGWVFKIK